MSIASPTLRSSSITAPGPSFSRSPTSISERPSTAETLTGTSNTASRSAAPRSTGPPPSSLASAPASTAAIAVPSRSGSGTSLLWSSLIASVSRNSNSHKRACSGARHRGQPRRHVAGDHVVDRRARRLRIARHAAFVPFDAAIACRHAGLGLHHQAALETAALGDVFQFLLGVVVDVGADPHHH